MIYIERSYLLQLSNRFRNFKQKNNLFNFSCPYCGDSSRNKFKARGYMLEKKGSFIFYCHNCHVTRGFEKFLEEQDHSLFQSYKLEKLKNSADLESQDNISTPHAQTSLSFPDYRRKGSPLRQLKKVSQLDWNHPVKKYIQDRQIPNPYHAKLFYCPKFYQWTNTMVPGKFEKVTKDERRLIIPFVDKQGKFFGYQGRALSASSLRYVTIMLDETRPKLFGLDEIDSSKRVHVVEGPFDSMFVDNCIAMAGSDAHVPFDDVVYIYDNEPRNKAIVDKMEKMINSGHKIVVWPTLGEKDINDMIVGGMSKAQLHLIIDRNTVSGLEAKMRLSVWKRV